MELLLNNAWQWPNLIWPIFDGNMFYWGALILGFRLQEVDPFFLRSDFFVLNLLCKLLNFKCLGEK